MTLEESYKICKQPEVSEDDCCHVIETYIRLLKGKVVKIKPPYADLRRGHPQSEAQYMIRVQMMGQAYDKASTFIMVLHDDPDRITVKTHK